MKVKSPMPMCAAAHTSGSTSVGMNFWCLKSASPVFHCVVKQSRPPDLKSSSNVSLPFSHYRSEQTDPATQKGIDETHPMLQRGKCWRWQKEMRKGTLQRTSFGFLIWPKPQLKQ